VINIINLGEDKGIKTLDQNILKLIKFITSFGGLGYHSNLKVISYEISGNNSKCSL
jgi:hypothetical protein